MSRARESRGGGNEWPIHHSTVGRARDLFPLVVIAAGVFTGFLQCQVKEVGLWFPSPPRNPRAILPWESVVGVNHLGVVGRLIRVRSSRVPIATAPVIRYAVSVTPKERVLTVHQSERRGSEDIHLISNQ